MCIWHKTFFSECFSEGIGQTAYLCSCLFNVPLTHVGVVSSWHLTHHYQHVFLSFIVAWVSSRMALATSVADGMQLVCHGGKSTGNWGEKEATNAKPLPRRRMWWATWLSPHCRARVAPAFVTLTCSLLLPQWSRSASVCGGGACSVLITSYNSRLGVRNHPKTLLVGNWIQSPRKTSNALYAMPITSGSLQTTVNTIYSGRPKWPKCRISAESFGRNSAETVSVFKSPFCLSAERPYFGRKVFFWQK